MTEQAVFNPALPEAGQQQQPSKNSQEYNEFLDFFNPSSSLQRPSVVSSFPLDVSKKRTASEKPKSSKQKYLNLINPNRSVKQILTEMRSKQKLRKQQIQLQEQSIRQQILFQQKAKEFALAEKKIKNRLIIAQKKEEKWKRKLIIKQMLTIEQQKDSVINNKSIKNSRPSKDQFEVVYSNVKREKIKESSNSQIITPYKSPFSGINQTKAIHHSQLIEQPEKQDTLQFSKKTEKIKDRKRKKFNLTTLPVEIYREQSPKKIDYLKQLPKRSHKSIQKQLQSLYNKQSQECFGKAVQLVQKIEHKRRLKLKNINQKDYQQAQNKLKLLNFFYSHQE